MSLATRIAQEFNNVYGHVSVPAAYHIYNGSVEATNTVVTNGFGTTLYTGNGGTQSINTAIDMNTQWGNDASEKFGGLVWIKSRSAATNNFLFDTIRGTTKEINSDTTEVEATLANSLTTFTSTGMTLGSATGTNVSAATYASWNFQTTHRTSGTTNHGKAYTCHYNPFTGFTIIKYEGSGLAGHEIPHMLGRKLGFVTVKNLSATYGWLACTETAGLGLNTTAASAGIGDLLLNENNTSLLTSSVTYNASTNQYIMYGWANSYFDEDNILIGNYEVGVYQGTGVAGNEVTTRGKPAWLIIKRLDSADNWAIFDNLRNNFDAFLLANSSVSEYTPYDRLDVNSDGFTLKSNDTTSNASGGQYLYMVVYDNDSGSGKSKYPRATDTTNLNINALVPYASGIDTNGSKVSISYKNETISGLTLTQGKNYPYSKNDGTYGVNKYEPMYGSLRNRSVAGENPDYFNLKTMKWYGTSGGNELVTNGTFNSNITGWTVTGSATWSSGTVLCNGNGTIQGSISQNITTVVGKKYTVRFYSDVAGTLGYTILSINGNVVINDQVSGIREYSFTAQNTTTAVLFTNGSSTAGRTARFDNISVFEAEPTIGAEITPRTYLDCVVYAGHNGQVSYVEELPKTTYFDEVKANEFKGKNACTAWGSANGAIIPPTIYDKYNIKSMIRVSTGLYDVYFEEPMANINYSVSGATNENYQIGIRTSYKSLDKCRIAVYTDGANIYVDTDFDIQIFGGRN